MIGKFKLFILLMALVALPIRGLAATAMWHCQADQHDAQSVQSDHHHGNHEHEAASEGGQKAGGSHHAVAEGAVEPTSSTAASACSACAACCVGGAAAPAAWMSTPVAPIGATRIAFVEPHFTGVVPAQLERPPLAQSL